MASPYRLVTVPLLPWRSGEATAGTWVTCDRSIHPDVDGIAAEREGEPHAIGLEVKHDAIRILQPQFPGADVADRKAGASLEVGPGKIGDVAEIVDLAGGGDLGDSEAADSQPADREAPALAAILQAAAAEVGAADPGDLHLLDLDGAGLVQIRG